MAAGSAHVMARIMIHQAVFAKGLRRLT